MVLLAGFLVQHKHVPLPVKEKAGGVDHTGGGGEGVANVAKSKPVWAVGVVNADFCWADAVGEVHSEAAVVEQHNIRIAWRTTGWPILIC